jgi:hypothetical protein
MRSSCEKCHLDAGDDVDEYRRLLQERRAYPCTPEEQAGKDATICGVCGRKALHQATDECMACDATELVTP